MAKHLYPSSFECDCGHRSHFSERVVREMREKSQKSRKPQGLLDSDVDEHEIEFRDGRATAVVCPRLGRREIMAVE